MLKQSLVVLMVAAGATLGAEGPASVKQPTLTPQNSGTTQGLIAVSAVNPQVVWAAGRNGTFTVTTDGGATWRAGVVAGAEALQFRDVEAVSAKVAYLLSIGNGTDSRIYKTEDGGATWTLQFQNQIPDAFYDCFAFWTPNRAIAQSDAVNGVFPVLRTTNGETWDDISSNLPPALPGESSFASSGTCVATQGGQHAWIATSKSRILATRDGGDTWEAYDTGLYTGDAAGAFSVAFRNAWNGIVGGGDLLTPDKAGAAVTSDGGMTWTLTAAPPVTGAIYGLAYVQGAGTGGRTVVVTADRGGAAWTPDEGTTWHALQDVSGYWAVTFASPKAGWLVGRNGTILKISF